MRFHCATCGGQHDGMPSYGWDYPAHYLAIAENERSARCILTTDTCVIDDQAFYVRGCLEISVIGTEQVFSWGVWTSLSEANFRIYQDLFDQDHRSEQGPFFGWFAVSIPLYPDTLHLKSHVHLRDHGIRPYVELEPTHHPLAVEQRNGITMGRVAAIHAAFSHPEDVAE